MVQTGTESGGTGLRTLLKRAVNVASVLYSTDVICLLHLAAYFWVKMETSAVDVFCSVNAEP